MDLFHLIIDRVADRNVFNLISGRNLGRDSHLHTRVDNDLIDGFLRMVHRASLISSNYGQTVNEAEITDQLYRSGQIVFNQFFPSRIREIFAQSEGGVLFLHLDQSLSHVPWELLHDGVSFLADRFIIGRSIAGAWNETSRDIRSKLRMLIVADPTGDLPAAREEGEILYETLNADISSDLLEIRFLSGRRIDRLTLLNELQDKDIVHYAGHTGRDEDGETGWLLANNKILRSTEIEKQQIPPFFVFSNSCSSFGSFALEESNRMASAFLRSGVSGYVGTTWDISDSNEVIEFAIEFYRNIFLERTIGESLLEARSKARKRNGSSDLTWAAYSLHGNPMQRLFRLPIRRSFDASRSGLNSRRVIEAYPLPIAKPYATFLEEQEKTGIPEPASFKLLRTSFLWLLASVGGTLFSLYKKMELRGEQPRWDDQDYESFAGHLYRFARRLHTFKSDDYLPGLVQPLLLHRENINKMIEILRLLENSENSDEAELLPYIIPFQFLLENLFVDLSLMGRVEWFQNLGADQPSFLLKGNQPSLARILPIHSHSETLSKELNEFKGRVCIHVPARRLLLDVSDGFRFSNGQLESNLLGLQYNVDVSE
ncbi:MAG: CHAT domain-containing protein [Leptonema sp. (in: Bacteria)]|nr:CHAT domain-containing protein [Leptonema sp. (in: bacteria)]